MLTYVFDLFLALMQCFYEDFNVFPTAAVTNFRVFFDDVV